MIIFKINSESNNLYQANQNSLWICDCDQSFRQNQKMWEEFLFYFLYTIK